MQLFLSQRIHRGWKSLPSIEASPQVVKEWRDKAAVLRLANPGKISFDYVKIGETIFVNCVGTLTELAEAGVDISTVGPKYVPPSYLDA